MIITEIKKNISVIKAHTIVFLLKSFIIYISLFPLKRAMNSFFNGRTINNDMFATSDINSLQEFLRASVSPNLGSFGFAQHTIAIVIGTMFLFVLFFIVIDGFIDAGMLYAIRKGKASSFFKGMRTYGFEFFKLRCITFISIVLFLVLCGFILPIDFESLTTISNNSILFSSLGIVIISFLLKAFDHAKHLVLKRRKKVGDAYTTSFKSIFINAKMTALFNLQTVTIFLLGYVIYNWFDNSFTVNTSGKIWIMVILFQVTLFGKQLLRYSYMSGVGQLKKEMEPK